MATINETLEVGPGPFTAPTGPGLTMEGTYAILKTDIVVKKDV